MTQESIARFLEQSRQYLLRSASDFRGGQSFRKNGGVIVFPALRLGLRCQVYCA